MSFQRATIEAIIERLETAVTELHSVERFNNQFEDLKDEGLNEEFPYRFPCAFVGLGGGEWLREPNGARQANPYTFRVHCGFDTYDGSLDDLDLIEDVTNALDMWSWTSDDDLYFIQMTFKREFVDEERTNVVEHILEFEALAYDCSLAAQIEDNTVYREVLDDRILRKIED